MNNEITKCGVLLLPKETNLELENFRLKHIHNPGKTIPFHVTLLTNFFLPKDINDVVIKKLEKVASSTENFEFFAKGISCFPTSKVLYMTPTPMVKIEELANKLYTEFPSLGNIDEHPIYHMTVGLGNEGEESDKVVSELIKTFPNQPMRLIAGSIELYVEINEQWHLYKSFKLNSEKNK